MIFTTGVVSESIRIVIFTTGVVSESIRVVIFSIGVVSESLIEFFSLARLR